jgi:hypothetical protein
MGGRPDGSSPAFVALLCQRERRRLGPQEEAADGRERAK